MAINVCLILGVIVAVVLTVLVYVLILPKSKEGKLGKFPQFLRDLFKFKKLFIEEILRFIYIFQTFLCIGIGFFMMFGQVGGLSLSSSTTKSIANGIASGIASGNAAEITKSINKAASSLVQPKSTFVIGLLILILGPILLRIAYELTMMLILLVSNVKEINAKLGTNMTISQVAKMNVEEVTPAVTPVEPVPTPEPVQETVTVEPVRENVVEEPAVKKCPQCGAEVSDEQKFCMTCGTEIK